MIPAATLGPVELEVWVVVVEVVVVVPVDEGFASGKIGIC